MTDLYTDQAGQGDWAAAVIQAAVSRLVVDVERFPSDEDESMSKVGMGAVYTKTSEGKLLRSTSPMRREQLMEEYYYPHHTGFSRAVGQQLQSFGYCLIIDVHSFPSHPLPYEEEQNADRPEICIGADSFHTPQNLLDTFVAFYEKQGYQVKVNTPFSGSIVPAQFYGKVPEVQSIMIELNRFLLVDATTGDLLPRGKTLLYAVKEVALQAIAGLER